jgi:hypothetical protein
MNNNMSEQEAWELDELLTRTTPEIDPVVEGPFIKHRNMMVVLDCRRRVHTRPATQDGFRAKS